MHDNPKDTDNVVSIFTRPAPQATTNACRLEAQGRIDVHDRLVKVLYCEDGEKTVGLRSTRAGEFWDLSPEQAEFLGLALIQVAAQVREETGDR